MGSLTETGAFRGGRGWAWLLAGCLALASCQGGPGVSPEAEPLLHCPDGTTRPAACGDGLADGGACGCTTYGVWCDEETGLCWQDPQKDALEQGKGGVTSADARRYCEELVLGGYEDWRLPDIAELRSIVAGNAFAEEGGACFIQEGSAMNGQPLLKQLPCLGNPEPLSGPGEGGCYWKAGLTGGCDNVDPASSTHFLETWSRTRAADDPDHWAAYVFFDTASVGFNHSLSLGEVRCVRDGWAPPGPCSGAGPACVPGSTRACACRNGKPGAQVCAGSGACHGPCDCTGFSPSPGPEDVCGRCDRVHVKIRVPHALPDAPYMLAAFLYRDGELFVRPPDAGIDENEIRHPRISPGDPVEMTIPGCSYYRDRCVAGAFYLVVYLKMKEGKFPGIPDPSDYVWVDFTPFTLTGDGTRAYEFDVTLFPIFPGGS